MHFLAKIGANTAENGPKFVNSLATFTTICQIACAKLRGGAGLGGMNDSSAILSTSTTCEEGWLSRPAVG